MYFYVDWLWIVLVLPAVIFSIIASAGVNSTFKKYSKVKSHFGLTGYMAARRMLNENGLSDIKIERVAGELTDHFDPRARVIRLSSSTYDSDSPAAIGVATHEVGHAIQYAQNYFPIKVRQAIIPITNIGSKLAIPLILIGILLSAFGEIYAFIAYFGVALYSLCVIFQLVTLPVEFNASKRAISALESSFMLTESELPIAKKVLRAAAMTYVAALAVSLAQLLRLLSIVSRSNRRR